MKKLSLAHVIGLVWVVAIIAVGMLAIVLRKPDTHVKFEHPRRQIVAYEPSSIEISQDAYLRAAAPVAPIAPAEPPPPVLMKGAKIVGEQASTEPQKLAHSLEGLAPAGTTVR